MSEFPTLAKDGNRLFMIIVLKNKECIRKVQNNLIHNSHMINWQKKETRYLMETGEPHCMRQLRNLCNTACATSLMIGWQKIAKSLMVQ